MRILRNILLIIFPVAMIISLYAFTFNGASTGEFRGMSYIYDNIQSFPSLNYVFEVIGQVREYAYNFQVAFTDGNILDFLKNFFYMVGYAFYVPIAVIVCVIQNLQWFIFVLRGY